MTVSSFIVYQAMSLLLQLDLQNVGNLKCDVESVALYRLTCNDCQNINLFYCRNIVKIQPGTDCRRVQYAGDVSNALVVISNGMQAIKFNWLMQVDL